MIIPSCLSAFAAEGWLTKGETGCVI